MDSKNQNKPPPPNPLECKKWKNYVVEKMVGPATAIRARQALSAVNGGLDIPASGDQLVGTSSDCGSNAGGMEFSSREDIYKLLDEKMGGKNKFDYKGKNEQMIGYIRKLRTCVRSYMELEDGYLMEQERMGSMLESEEKKHAEIEAHLRHKIDELNANIEEFQRQYASVLDKCRKEEADKLAITESYEREREARIAAENSRATLSDDLERTSQEVKRVSDQFKLLQETNKRLQEYNTSLQQYNSNLQADTQKNGETILKLQNEKNSMMEALAFLRNKSNLLESQLDSYRSSKQEAITQRDDLTKEVGCLRSELKQVREDRDCQSSQVQSLMDELVTHGELILKSTTDLEKIMTKSSALEVTVSSQREQIQTLEEQLASANEKLLNTDLTKFKAIVEFKVQKEMVEKLQNRLTDAEHQIFEAEKLRKKLHNTILELKGNIRVFCRVRPLLPDNDFDDTEGAMFSYPTSTEVLGRGIDLVHNAQKYSFTFDKVFDHEASQEDVFVEISQLVQSALDGYKVCIFAYGQTGSGKTYTMMGMPEASEERGLIPRSLEQIFCISQSLQSQGWKYKMQASMLEIYNETIRDLLSPGRAGNHDIGVGLSKQYAIKHESNGNTHVSDLTVVDVRSIKEVSFLLQQAAQSRSVGKTQMNEQSSRSHFVFTLRISGVNENTEQQVHGVLNLIDLAGSERLNKSGSTGDRLKETQAINKSLSALSDVIFAITKKEDHVPFRNSKLTYLLQPCLGGDSKTLMFVNLSPKESSVGESICSLRFAARVNSCEIGVPRRQTQARSSELRLSYG